MSLTPKLLVIVIIFLGGRCALADHLLLSYEGNVVPYASTEGWGIARSCQPYCSDGLNEGIYSVCWPKLGTLFYYYYWIARTPETPPPTLWAEWHFRSNQLIIPNNFDCGGFIYLVYRGINQTIYMLADAAVSGGIESVVLGLDPDVFHTYRFESIDGINYTFAVDGKVFHVGHQNKPTGGNIIEMGGDGGCVFQEDFPVVHQWDFVRYGTINYAENILTNDPPPGFVHAGQHLALDRFTVQYEAANYVYIDEITVESTSLCPPSSREKAADAPARASSIPIVTATRRLDNGSSDVVEIVLDRPIPYNATTRFTFNDGALAQSLEFTYAPGDIDGDGAATLSDMSAFQNCFGAALFGVCPVLDFDANEQVDLVDFHHFESAMSSP